MEEKEQKKKEIYKNWWFWVIVIIIIGAMGSQLGNNDNVLTGTNSNPNANSTSNTKAKVEVTVIDFSTMTYDDISTWCANSNIKVNKTENYSDTVTKGEFVSQSVKANEKIYEGDTIKIIYSLGKEPTLSQKNAVKKAEQYLSMMSFSRTGLIKQLEFEGYSKDDSTYAVDNITVDWDKQAVEKAQQYLDTMAFSRSGLIKQLEFEGFTKAQATHGVDEVGL